MDLQTPRIEMLPLAALRPYSGNARRHSKKQVRQIADSIVRFGFTNPILVSDDSEIVAGHGRVMAAKELGLKTVPTVKLSPLSAEERRAYVLADNKLALNAGWDSEILAIELQANMRRSSNSRYGTRSRRLCRRTGWIVPPGSIAPIPVS